MTQIYSQKTWSSERILDSDMNRMERGIAGRVYHVFAGGTKGDFTTIQEAIDQCESDGFGTVRIHGEITITSPLTIQGDNIALVADGDGIIKKGVSLDDNSLEIGQAGTAVNNIMIKGVIFDGNKANQTGAAYEIDILRANSLLIKDCEFKNMYGDGIHCAANTQTDHQIVGNLFESGNDDCIIYDAQGSGLKRVRITRNTFIANLGTPIKFGNADNAEYVVITDNLLNCVNQTAADYGILFSNSITYIMIARNMFYDVYTDAIALSAPLIGHILDNNIMTTGGEGINIAGGQYLQIDGNSMNDIGANGIECNDLTYTNICNNTLMEIDDHGIYVYGTVTMCNIGNNLINNAGTSANNTKDAIYLDGVYCGVKSNHTTSNAGNKHRYGVNETGTKNHVVANSDHAAATGPTNVAGAGSQSSANTSTV